MNYENFRNQIVQKHGDFFSLILYEFCEKAAEFGGNEKYEDALSVGKDAFVIAMYSNMGYGIVYLIGMLCQAYLDNDQPEKADACFNTGISMLDKMDIRYDDNVNSFLDLKIIIDEELNKKFKTNE